MGFWGRLRGWIGLDVDGGFSLWGEVGEGESDAGGPSLRQVPKVSGLRGAVNLFSFLAEQIAWINKLNSISPN